MPTTKKPAGEAPKPKRGTAKADTAAAKETPEVKPAATRRTRKPQEASIAPEPVAVPIEAPTRDRTLVAAIAFVTAAAVFALGFGIGRASSDGGSPIMFGADREDSLPGPGPFADGRPDMPMPHGPGHHGGGMFPGPFADGQPDMPMPHGPGHHGGGMFPGPGPGSGDDDAVPPPIVAGQAFLGIAGFDAPPGGVKVTEVEPGSGADAAGVQPGDRIVSVGDTRIAGMDQLRELIGSSQPGTTITIDVDRDGERLTLTATLGTRAD